ncbi:NUDIX domain-containing protein [archaeon]|jgi:hypothetical protein|nr:NUDIX domain-containing protein [archaeon]MBT3730607.1 NUDIX domain-containing protein [archaeon]MBT4669509.1 NUDIX domain-containing protein [archaeon]MBT5030266.1 NUDIX domain-containing protein [archaeon]MBT5287635.1 NUDIX domain-containing protein [archaeon]
MTENLKFAPREIFEQILEWAVIPTFDLIIETENGVVLVKRKIAPYKDVWALPGLRMFKGESINDVLKRIAKKEINLEIDTNNKIFLGQYVGYFKTECARQDLSSGYYIKCFDQEIIINEDHFYSVMFVTKKDEIPRNIGAMYKFYLEKYFELKSNAENL